MPLRLADIDMLIVPGWANSDADHWQSRWQRRMPHVRRIQQAEWEKPMIGDWVTRIVEAVAAATRPAVLVAHSCGVPAVVHAASLVDREKVAGAFLVAPTDLALTNADWRLPGGFWPTVEGGFHPVPSVPLPFPSVVIASNNDPYVELETARGYALDWGADFADAGASGHINAASGHGPWPEGLLRLGMFLQRLPK